MVTVKQAATQLRCSTSFVYKLFGLGEISGYRNGSHIRIHPESLTEYIARHSNQTKVLESKGVLKKPEPRKKTTTYTIKYL